MPAMRLFDDIHRSDLDSRARTEHPFMYLNRSARPEMQALRDLLETWFSAYPKIDQEDLRNNFSNESNLVNHNGAFFELFIHSLLIHMGFDNIDTHSDNLAEGSVDFLVSNVDGQRFLVEATSMVNSASSKNYFAMMVEIIESIESSDFFLHVIVEKLPTEPIVPSKLKHFLNQKLASISWEDIYVSQEESLDDLPEWQYKEGGAEVIFRPSARSQSLRNSEASSILGTMINPVDWSKKGGERIRRKAKKKINQLGNLEMPYIVAINVDDLLDEKIDTMEALFGSERHLIDRTPEGEPRLKIVRDLDGLWRGPDGVQNTRVSAVLVFKGLSIFSIPYSICRLYHNPWAKYPLNSDIFPIPQAVPKNGEMLFLDGRSPGEVLQIPGAWPDR